MFRYKSKYKKVEVLPNAKHRYSAGLSSLVPITLSNIVYFELSLPGAHKVL